MAGNASSMKMLATLGIAGMLSGATLVGVYTATAPRIARNRAEALAKAIFEVVPGAETKDAWVVRDGALVQAEPAEGEEAVYAAYDAQGKRLGFAVPAEGGGFQDTIMLIYGVDPERRLVLGMRVLESRETPGLGDKIIKDDDFVGAFSELALDPAIVATKKGATQPFEIDAISGATISSKAVVTILNDANVQWLPLMPSGGDD